MYQIPLVFNPSGTRMSLWAAESWPWAGCLGLGKRKQAVIFPTPIHIPGLWHHEIMVWLDWKSVPIAAIFVWDIDPGNL